MEKSTGRQKGPVVFKHVAGQSICLTTLHWTTRVCSVLWKSISNCFLEKEFLSCVHMEV